MAVSCSRKARPAVQEGTEKVNSAVQLVPKKLPEAYGIPQRPERKSHGCLEGWRSNGQGEGRHKALAGARGRSRKSAEGD